MQAGIEFGTFMYVLFVEVIFNAILVIIMYPLISKFGLYLEGLFNSKEMLTRYF